MSDPRDRWEITHGNEHGPYALFAGFESDIRDCGEITEQAYDKLDIYEQIAMFGFVSKLLEEVYNES